MTPDQLSAIRERLDAASPDILNKNKLCFGDCCRTKAERKVIANAPTDLRALLDEVERLTKREDVLVKAGLDLMVANKDLTAEVERLQADPLPAAAWVREVERAAFARGAEAMREAAAQLVIREVEGWMQLGLSGDIRDLPIPEDKQ